MASSLHQQLKRDYAERLSGEMEVTVGRYRIDVATADRLYEVQSASLSALRDKIRELTQAHRVTVVKPIIRHKTIVRTAADGQTVLSRRRSPKSGQWWHVFDELMYLREIFPHPRLAIDLVMVDVEEWRLPKPRRRFRGRDFQVLDRRIIECVESRTLEKRDSPLGLLPGKLPRQFHSGLLSQEWGLPRWLVQRAIYFLRETGVIEPIGRCGRGIEYRKTGRKRPAA